MSRQSAGVRLNATDFYPTPLWCIENLNIKWDLFTSAHEPCKGDGRLLNFLNNKNIPTTYSEILEDLDFFDWSDSVDLIITNPPFSLAKEFIEHSLAHANTVIFLLRLNFLGSIKRHDWWVENSPNSLFVLSKRPSFTGTGTDATDYAWFVWDKTGRIPSGVHFVDVPTDAQAKRDNQSAKEALKNPKYK